MVFAQDLAERAPCIRNAEVVPLTLVQREALLQERDCDFVAWLVLAEHDTNRRDLAEDSRRFGHQIRLVDILGLLPGEGEQFRRWLQLARGDENLALKLPRHRLARNVMP